MVGHRLPELKVLGGQGRFVILCPFCLRDLAMVNKSAIFNPWIGKLGNHQHNLQSSGAYYEILEDANKKP